MVVIWQAEMTRRGSRDMKTINCTDCVVKIEIELQVALYLRRDGIVHRKMDICSIERWGCKDI